MIHVYYGTTLRGLRLEWDGV